MGILIEGMQLRFNSFLTILFVFLFSTNSFAQSDYKTAKSKCREGGLGINTNYSNKQCTPDFGLSGSAELLSHFAYRGLSYSGTQPSLIASFLYSFGSQFKLGAWGANLNLADSNLWLKLVMEIQLKFADQHDVTLFVHKDQFYSNGDRNGVEVGVNYFFLDKFYFGLSEKDNFEATHTASEYISFAHTIPITKIFSFTYKIGYTNQRDVTYDSYVDGKLSLAYDFKNSTVETGITDMTSKDKFNQKAEPHLYVSLLAYY
jgi:uncharacterized protein (TIGR02001 family)